MGKKIILLLWLMLIIFPITSAISQVNINQNAGIQIDFPKYETIKNNEPFNVSIHNINVSTGKLLLGSNCSVEIYNKTGDIIYNSPNFTQADDHYFHYISRGNFSSDGYYTLFGYCENNDIGGFFSGVYEINSLGVVLTTSYSITYFSFFILLIFFFFITLWGIEKLPSTNARDEEGKILKVSYLKYFRSTLWLFEWMFLIGILFIASNLGFAYLGENLFATMFFTLFRISLGITPLIIIVWILSLVAKIIEDKTITTLMRRGGGFDYKI